MATYEALDRPFNVVAERLSWGIQDNFQSIIDHLFSSPVLVREAYLAPTSDNSVSVLMVRGIDLSNSQEVRVSCRFYGDGDPDQVFFVRAP